MAKRRKLKTKKLILAILLLVLLVFMGWCIFFIVNTLHKFNTGTHQSLTSDLSDLGIESGQEQLGLTDDASDSSITNIALFGIDERVGEPSRSDTIMVATVDKRHNKIKLSSVMRDTYIPVDGHGNTKLNSAYFYGGPTLAIKTLNQQFGLNITDYVAVNFSEMAQIVDAVGGVDIELTEAERKDANHNMIEQAAIDNSKVIPIKGSGMQHLNGMQAVAYARIRYVGNADFERTQRQRDVLRQIFEKGKSMNPLQYPGMITGLLPVVETSLDIGEILSLASIMLRDISMEDARFPCNEDLIGDGRLRIDGMEYLECDLSATKEKLNSYIFDDVMPVQP